MSGKDDRNDLSGEGAVRPGLTATVALYAPAGSHSRRSLGQSAVIPHAICNYEYYQRRSPTIERYRRRSSARVWSNCGSMS